MRALIYSFLALFVAAPAFSRTHAPTIGKGRPLAPVVQEKDDALLVLQLARELSDEDPLVRSYAAKQLAKFGKDAEDAVPFLIRLIKEQKTHMDIRDARNALIAIGEPSLKLITVLHNEHYTFIKDAINKNKAEALFKKYHSTFNEAEFIGKLVAMGPDALPFLKPFMDSRATDSDKMSAILVLSQMGDKILPHLERLYLSSTKHDNYHGVIMDTLWALNTKMAQSLFVKGLRSRNLRLQSLRELERRVSSPAEADTLPHAQAIAEALPNLIKYSDWGVVGEAMATTRNFGHLNKAKVINALEFAIKNNNYAESALQDTIKALTEKK